MDPLGIGGMRITSPADSEALDPVPDDRVISPSSLLLLGDGLTGGNGVIRDGTTTLSRVSQGEEFFGSTKRSLSRHGGNADVGFADGHVAATKLVVLFDKTSDESLAMWNRDNTPHAIVLRR